MANETDPTLKDVLGAIVSDISHARRISDMEVMRIANLYREHDYLDGLSVPRLRINQVVLDLPVMLGDSIPGKPCKANNAETIIKHILLNADKFAPQMNLFMSKEKGKLREEIYAILSLLRSLLFKQRDESLWEDKIGSVLIEQLRAQLPEVFAVANIPPESYKHLPDVVIVDSVKKIIKTSLLDLLPNVLKEILTIGLEDKELRELTKQMKTAGTGQQGEDDPVAKTSNYILQLMLSQVDLQHLLDTFDIILGLSFDQIEKVLERVNYPQEMYVEQFEQIKNENLTNPEEIAYVKISLVADLIEEVVRDKQPHLLEDEDILDTKLRELIDEHTQGSKRRKTKRNPTQPTATNTDATQKIQNRIKIKDLSEKVDALAIVNQKRKNWSEDDLQNIFIEVVETSVIKQFVEFLSNLAVEKTILNRTETADFHVRVDTESIKNAGTPQAITRLRLVLREEGLEWMKEDGIDGEDSSWKLLAE